MAKFSLFQYILFEVLCNSLEDLTNVLYLLLDSFLSRLLNLLLFSDIGLIRLNLVYSSFKHIFFITLKCVSLAPNSTNALYIVFLFINSHR